MIAGIIRVEPTNICGARPHRRSVVRDTEMQRLKPAAELGDCLNIGHTKSSLDQRLKAHGRLDATTLFDLIDHRLNHMKISGDTHFGHQKRVNFVAGLFHDVDDITVHVVRISTSYVNLLEKNERSVSVSVLLKLMEAYRVDWRDIAQDDEASQLANMRGALQNPIFGPNRPDLPQLRAALVHSPDLADSFLRLHRAYLAISDQLMSRGGLGRVRCGCADVTGIECP